MVGDVVELVGVVRLGIETVQARRADQAIHRGHEFAASVGANEQAIVAFYWVQEHDKKEPSACANACEVPRAVMVAMLTNNSHG